MKEYMNWKGWLILPLLLILSLAVVACGPDQTPTPAPGDQTDVTAPDPLLPEPADPTPLMDPTVDVEIVDMTPTVDVDMTPTVVVMETETPLPQATGPADVITDTDVITGTQDTMLPEDRVALVRSADIIGVNIINAADDVIARIEDVLFDDDGEIHTIVLTVYDTGQTTVDQDFAYYGIEWDNFAIVRHDEDLTQTGTDTQTDTQTTTQPGQTGFHTGVLLYEENSINLTNAVGIEDEWLEEDDIFYNISVEDTDDAATQPHILAGLYRLSAFAQFRLFNPDLVNPGIDEDLGVVEDMIVNVDEGTVQYAVAEIGGWLGIGRTTVIIPWQRVGYDEEEEYFVIDATQEELENAPMMELDRLDEWEIDPTWERDIEEYWGTMPRN